MLAQGVSPADLGSTDAETGLSLPIRRMMATLIACLLEGTNAHLTALAEALPDIDTDQAVKEHRIRRFLSTPQLSPQQVLTFCILLFLLAFLKSISHFVKGAFLVPLLYIGIIRMHGLVSTAR